MMPTRSRAWAQIHNPLLWALALVAIVGNLYVPAPVDSFRNVIAYSCGMGDDRKICIINADGSGFRQLTQNFRADSSPSINSKGQIAFLCEYENDVGLSQREICAIEITGGEPRRLTDAAYDKSDPEINNNGWIVYRCLRQGESLCRAHVDRDVEPVFPGPPVLGRHHALNDKGEIVYACRGSGSQDFRAVCLMNVEGEARQLLSDAGVPIISLDVNNAGQIVMECNSSASLNLEEREICSLTTAGGELKMLTRNNYLDGLPSINDNGLIAFECDVTSSSFEQICLMGFDGSRFRILTQNNFDNGAPAISPDGIVAHICRARDAEICTIRADSTGEAILTSNSTDKGRPDIN